MQLTVDLEDELGAALEQQAAAEGESASEYARAAIKQRLSAGAPSRTLSVEERARRIDEALEKLRQSGASLGRNGRPWREFTHEGHRY